MTTILAVVRRLYCSYHIVCAHPVKYCRLLEFLLLVQKRKQRYAVYGGKLNDIRLESLHASVGIRRYSRIEIQALVGKLGLGFSLLGPNLRRSSWYNAVFLQKFVESILQSCGNVLERWPCRLVAIPTLLHE